MPNVPGLTPTDTPSPAPRQPLNQRVVPRDNLPDPQRLQPVAAPVDTYARPAMPSADNPLTMLAQSLSTIHPPLQQFANVQADKDRDELPGKVMAAKLTSKDDAEFQQRLRTDPELAGPIAQKLGAKQLGMSVSESAVEGLTQRYMAGEFDKVNGKLEDWMNDQARKDLAAHGNDPTFADGYGPRFVQARDMLRADLTKYRAGLAQDQQKQTFTGAALSIVNGDADVSADPGKTVGHLTDQMRSNQDFLRMSPQEQADLQLGLAKQLMARIGEDPARAPFLNKVVDGLLNADRTGPDGKSMGSLLTNFDTGGKAASILAETRSAYQRQANLTATGDTMRLNDLARTGDPGFQAEMDRQVKEDPKRYSEAQQISFHNTFTTATARLQAHAAKQIAEEGVRQAESAATTQALIAGQKGEMHMLQPVAITLPDGKVKVISADDQIKAATSVREQQIADEQGRSGDEAKAFKDRVDWYSNNASADAEQWQRTLRYGPAAITTAVAASEGKVATPKALTDAYALYKRLDAAAPGLAYKFTDDKSRDFYERARVMEDMGRPESEALGIAARAITDKNFDRDAPSFSWATFERGANARLSTWWGTSLIDTSNQQEVKNDYRHAVDNLVRGNHMPFEQAMDMVGERLKRNYTIINGVAVRTVDKRVPQDFGDVANRYLDGYFAAHAEELTTQGFDRNDLSMAAVGKGNAWRIVDKARIASPFIPDATVTLQDMVTTSQAMQREKAAKEQADLAQTQADRDEAFFNQAERLRPQVAGHHAIIVGPGGSLMKSNTAADFLKQMLGNPQYASGKAVVASKKAAVAAGNAKTDDAIEGAQGVYDIPTP